MKNLALCWALGWLIAANATAQNADIRVRNKQMLAPVPMETRVLLATDARLRYWADLNEVLFVDIDLRPLDTLKMAEIVAQTAASRLFITDNYPQAAELKNWATGRDLLVFDNIPMQTGDISYIINDPNLSLLLCEGLRAYSPNSLRIWWLMGAGLMAGLFAYFFFRLALWYKKQPIS